MIITINKIKHKQEAGKVFEIYITRKKLSFLSKRVPTYPQQSNRKLDKDRSISSQKRNYKWLFNTWKNVQLPIRLAKIKKNLGNPLVCASVERILSYFACWDCEWRTIWQYLSKFTIHLSFDPAFPLLGIYPTGKFTDVPNGPSSSLLWHCLQ